MNQTDRAGAPDSFRDDSGWVGAPADDDLDQRLAAEDEPFDEDLPHVMTALGAIPPAALGVTLFGSWERPLLAPGREPGAALVELEQLYAIGIRTIVDLAPAASARYLADLTWISQRSPVHIVVGAGSTTATSDEHFHFGISLVETLPVEGDLAGRIARPPFLRAETWSAADRLATMHSLIEYDWTNWTVVAEPEYATRRLVQSALGAGARIVLVVADGDADAMAGAALLIRDLVELGFGDRLSLGYNVDLIVVIERFPLLLMEAGLPAIAVRRILIDNPAEALTTQTRQW